MKKKIFVFLSVISICLLHVNYYDVFADSQNYKKIIFTSEDSWELVTVDIDTFTVSVELELPGFNGDVQGLGLYSLYSYNFIQRGEPNAYQQRYKFEYVDSEKVRLLMSLKRFVYCDYLWDYDYIGSVEAEICYDNPLLGYLSLYMSENFVGFYNSRFFLSDLMKNFLRAEPNFDNGSLVGNWGEEKYYLYLGGYVYLPDGTKRSITIMPDLIDDYFENYDYVVLAFNLSPRTRFWSPDIYPNESISGLSYIVYDMVANSTTYYDYQGNIVVQVNGLSYIDNPQFYIPEIEALDYQLKASYEEGKNEGYRQGREEGERAGKKKMQEEMQQVIDNLTEYYEKEIEKAYNRGKNDGASEQLEVFGYLQALFGEQGLGRLLRLELLPGVSLGAVIMIPLAFWLVSFIMRWFR